MKIKIEEKNRDKIAEELIRVEKRCSARTVEVDEIFKITEKIKVRLKELKVPSKLKGQKFTYENGHYVASSYNGYPESTQFKIEKFASGFFLTSLYRYYCNHGGEIRFENENEYRQYYKAF